MSVEVSCPNCKSVLKAPEGMAGKKARCKKCQTKFLIPGAAPAAETDRLGDPQQLSAVDSKATGPTPPRAADNPFAFDDAPSVELPPARPSERRKEKPAAPPPEADDGPGSDNPFAMASEGGVDAGEDRSHRPARRRSGRGGAGKLVAVGLIGLACAGGGAAGVYFWMQSQNKPTVASAPAGAADNSTPVTPPGPTAEEAASDKPTAAAKPGAAKGEPAARQMKKGGGVTVTGGFKLPAFPAGKGEVVEKAKYRFPVEADPAKVRRVLLSGPDAAIAVVVWRSFDGFKGAGATDTVDRYSLNSGQRVDRQEVAADGPWPRACDLSPEGNRLATEAPAGKLTVWDLNQKSKIVDALDPYKGAKKDQGPGIAAVYFLEEEKLAVVSRLGDVDVWDLKAKERALEGTRIDGIKPDAPLTDRRTVTITPDRRTVLAYANGTVYEVPTSSGKPRAGLTLPHAPSAGLTLAADASGARVVVAYRAADPGPHTRLVVARIGEEKPQLDLTLDEAAGVPVAAEWTGQETALVVVDKDAVGLFVDAEVNRLTAAVKPTAAPAAQQPGAATGLSWCVVPDPADAKKAVLVGIPLPHDSYFAMRDAGGNKPVGLTIGAEGLGK